MGGRVNLRTRLEVLLKKQIIVRNGKRTPDDLAHRLVTMLTRYMGTSRIPLKSGNPATFSITERTGLFISPSGISELDCATTKTDTAEGSISIGRESLQVFLVLGALAYFQVPPLGGSREEKWRSQ